MLISNTYCDLLKVYLSIPQMSCIYDLRDIADMFYSVLIKTVFIICIWLYFRTGKAFNLIYDKPWTRIGAYAVGFLAGYILYRTNCKIKMPKVTLHFFLKSR